MTILDYYKSYGMLAKAIGLILTALPFLSNVPPKDYTAYAFPPLGPFTPVAQLLTVALGLFATLIAFFAPSSKPVRTLGTCAFLFAICLVLYGWSFSDFAREVNIESEGKKIWVSVGYERTEFVTKDPELSKKNDWDLLHDQGSTEDRIEKLWTSNSIHSARLRLWAPYCGLMFISFLTLGIAVVSAQSVKSKKTHP